MDLQNMNEQLSAQEVELLNDFQIEGKRSEWQKHQKKKNK